MKLIIINGLPATGKSIIAKQLSSKLNVPFISKDTIKEFLFEALGSKDREWSRILGQASNDFLYDLTGKMLASGESLIIENAFERSFAEPRLQDIIADYKPRVLEIYCSTDKKTRRERFSKRNESGDRHEGHADTVNYLKESEPEPYEKYAPLEVSEIVHIDTTNPNDINVDKLVEVINSKK